MPAQRRELDRKQPLERFLFPKLHVNHFHEQKRPLKVCSTARDTLNCGVDPLAAPAWHLLHCLTAVLHLGPFSHPRISQTIAPSHSSFDAILAVGL